MKKLIILITIFIILSSKLLSYEFSLGDDLLAMNLFTPIENARTFNFYTSTPLLFGIELDLDYSLYTSDINTSRVDEISLLLKYPIDRFKIMKITPSIGLTLTGDLSGDDFLGTLDKIVSEDLNSTLTEEEQVNLYFNSSLLFNKLSQLIKSDRNSISIYSNVYSEIEVITNYTISAKIGYALLFSGNNFSTNLGYSYGYQYNFTDFETINYVKDLEDEGKLNLTITAGDFKYNLDLFIDGSFSTGKYSVNFGFLPEGPELTKIDLKVTPGTEYDIGSGKLLSSLQIDFIPMEWELSRFEIQLKSTYGYNEPCFDNTDLDELFYSETYYNKLTVGGNLCLIENSAPYWINPYIGLGIGYENYRYYNDSDENNIIPVYEIRVGFNTLLPQFLIKDNVKYGFNSNITFRDSLNDIKYCNKFLLNIGLLIAIEL